jgi:hypothetical protein
MFVFVLELVALGIAVAFLLYALLLLAVLRLKSALRLFAPSDPISIKGTVTVVVAARDEADSVGLCLESLLVQQQVSQVVLVDDHSQDETLAVARVVAARDARVRVLSAPELPKAWIGKTFALHCGAKEARTPFILFTDADVFFGPGVIGEAVSRMEAMKLDHLSGHFCIDCQTIAEEICAPVLALTSGLALFSTAQSIGAATGAFNMVRTSTYWNWGGHEAIKAEIVDDVALARHLKHGGAKSQFLFMGDRVKVRLFIGFAGFWEAVFRSAVPFLKWGALPAALAALSLAVLVFITLVGLLLPFLAEDLSAHYARPLPLFFVLSFIPYCLGAWCVFIGRRFTNGRWLFVLFYPIAALVMTGAVIQSAIDRLCGRPLIWRGRAYAARSCQFCCL